MAGEGGRSPLVGRAAELDRLNEAFRRSVAGEVRGIVLGGEAGIGKTSLLAAFVDGAAAQGARILSGACLPLTSAGIPYAPFVEMLRRLVRATEPARLPALLGPSRGELIRLLPELSAHRSTTTTPGGPSGGGGVDTRDAVGGGAFGGADRTAQSRLFELILGVGERLEATAPVVMSIEDLHWSDQSTRDLLQFLVRTIRSGRFLVVLTTRSDELQEHRAALALVADLERLGWFDRLELRRLDRADTALQVEALLGAPPPEELVQRIWLRSEGNPLFAAQLVAAAGEGDPDALPLRLHDVLRARLAVLSQHAREVLRVAAAAGRRVDDRLLVRVLSLPEATVLDALREAVGHGILRIEPDGGGVVFSHALLREVASRELFGGEQERLHRAFAVALTNLQAEGVPPDPAELAYHWDLGRDASRALEAHIQAGQAAERVYAHAEALAHFERALVLLADLERTGFEGSRPPIDRVDLTRRAAESACLAGSFRRAIDLGRRAIEEFGPDGDPGRLGLLNERLRWYLWEAGDRAAAAHAVSEALRLIPETPPTHTRARALGQLAGLQLMAGDYTAAAATSQESAAAAAGAGIELGDAFAMGVGGWAEAVRGDVDAGLGQFRAGLNIARATESVEGLALGYAMLSTLLDRVGRSPAAVTVALEGLAETERYGVLRTYGGHLLGNAAKAMIDLGRWPQADRLLADGLRRIPSGPRLVWVLIVRGWLDLRSGSLSGGEERLADARRIDESLGGTEFRMPLLVALVELAAARGHMADQRALAAEARARPWFEGALDVGHLGLAAIVVGAEADEAEVARARRDGIALDAARRAVEAARPSHLEFGGPVGTALEMQIGADLARFEGTDSAEMWERVGAAWAALGRPHHVGWASYRSAAALLRSRGRPESAADHLRAAALVADELGAATLGSAVAGLARRARVDLVARQPGGSTDGPDPDEPAARAMRVFGLTRRELEVLRLLARGRTNGEIAAELFITRKTASVHVSAILSKLEVRSRVEAAAVAVRMGLVPD